MFFGLLYSIQIVLLYNSETIPSRDGGDCECVEGFTVALLSISTPYTPHQPFQNRTIPRKALPHLPPLSKGGGLTARHKP